jgi:hypothetical protein
MLKMIIICNATADAITTAAFTTTTTTTTVGTTTDSTEFRMFAHRNRTITGKH